LTASQTSFPSRNARECYLPQRALIVQKDCRIALSGVHGRWSEQCFNAAFPRP
jgi:hypothetical protein